MKITDLQFDLPESLIAQEPNPHRDHSRMLVLDRATGHFQDRHFYDLPEFLRPGDVLVLNNTRVFPARLIGTREGHTGRIELLLVREIEPNVWETLVRPGRRIQVGARLSFGGGVLTAEVLDRTDTGHRIVKFDYSGSFFDALDQYGRTPLPPYIHRDDADDLRLDRETYQTVYARNRGSIAAPTAGLHFTPEILDRIKRDGVEVVELTLHVGYGTFQPVQAENIEEHRVEAEYYDVPAATAERVTAAKREGRRVIAVGTTSTRTLESVVAPDGVGIVAGSGTTDLTIFPGFTFRVLDGLITNFHLPGSSLIALVAAFGGYEPVMRAYRHAVAERYRFYSYGDCMFLC